jgi:uncharacterized protein YceK
MFKLALVFAVFLSSGCTTIRLVQRPPQHLPNPCDTIDCSHVDTRYIA